MSWSQWTFPESSAARGRARSIEVRTKVGNKYVKRATHIFRGGKWIKWSSSERPQNGHGRRFKQKNT